MSKKKRSQRVLEYRMHKRQEKLSSKAGLGIISAHSSDQGQALENQPRTPPANDSQQLKQVHQHSRRIMNPFLEVSHEDDQGMVHCRYHIEDESSISAATASIFSALQVTGLDHRTTMGDLEKAFTRFGTLKELGLSDNGLVAFVVFRGELIAAEAAKANIMIRGKKVMLKAVDPETIVLSKDFL